MKLGIMQPYFFPYIGYWQLINAVDRYVIFDDVNYIKGGWIKRNQILINGEGRMITLQVHNASQNVYINKINILEDPIYDKNLLKTIEICYRKAPQYENVFPVIKDIIMQCSRNLATYLEYSIKSICEYLSINTDIVVSSTLNKNNNLKCQDKVIDICKTLGADEYFNAIGGKDLYSYNDFASENIKLNFLKTGSIIYKQFKNKFVPNLSIIDVMMFNSLSEIHKMLNNYELIQHTIRSDMKSV